MRIPTLSRRALLAVVASALPALTFAQSSRPIEWVVGYPAGGGSDVVARTVADVMSKTLAQPIVINNEPGAATIMPGTPKQMAQYTYAKSARWGKVVESAGVKLD